MLDLALQKPQTQRARPREGQHGSPSRERALSALIDRSDGSAVSAPLSWHPRLRQGTDVERANWRLIGNSVGVHWPALDEDIGVAGLVLGRRSAGERGVLGGVGGEVRWHVP